MSFAFNFDFRNEEFIKYLNGTISKANNLSTVMEEIGAELESEIRLNFEQEQTPYGEPWKALSASTQKSRRSGKGSGSNKILRDTGDLFNSITHNADRSEVEVGTSKEYGAVHQEGSDEIPARIFLPTEEDGLPNDWQDAIDEIVIDHFRTVV
jgi:phage virion morphogenesis protein